MNPKYMFDPKGFKNVEKNGKVIGFQFDFKMQYYRGVTLSIIRNIEVNVDGEEFNREDIRFTLEGDTFTLDEMETVITYRWKYGQYATVTVLKDGGLAKGKHHIKAVQTIAPSYMPMILVKPGEYDFEIV
ncbi:MAG TPA: hypothetical protein GXX75_17960 [Clostridiales bacterium]|nr:hypothetical protein [Clostridiales bacterium]